MNNISTAAVLAAFRLAAAHCHHWASPVTPARLAAGRARRDAAARREELPEYWERASDGSRVGVLDGRDLGETADESGRPPRTAEEADAMGWLPTCLEWGITFSLAHRTGSGRLGWEIDPATGTTVLTVYRPGDRVVAVAVVRPDGRVTVDLKRPLEIEDRHAACLAAAINVAVDRDAACTVAKVMDAVYAEFPRRRIADAMAAIEAR